MVKNTVVVFPVLPRKDMVLHVLDPWGRKTKLKWKLDESSRKRSKTPNQGCFMAKSTAIAKTHPLGTIDSDYLKSSIYENCKMVYEDG